MLSIVAGGIVLARPDHSLRALAVIIGIFILIDGVVELYWAIVHRVQSTATAALLGILNVVVGVLLIRHPIAGVQAVALFIGIWLIAVGVVRAVVAFEATGRRARAAADRGRRDPRGDRDRRQPPTSATRRSRCWSASRSSPTASR